LNKLSSIKEARLAKGLTIGELSIKLNISSIILKKIENNEELPDRFKSYEDVFRKNILKSLGLYTPSSFINLNPIPEDNTKLILTIFSFLFVSLILLSLSFDMYKKFNLISNLKLIEKDQIYLDTESFLFDLEYEEIDHYKFMNKLTLSKNNNFDNIFQISVIDNNSIFYRVIDNKQKTINFGTITSDNPLKLDFNGDFFIDLSNIKFIDKIVAKNYIYQLDVDKPYVLKKLNINKFLNSK